MNMRERKRQNLLAEWTEKIAERRRSGMPVKQWCAENGIKESTYHYWLRRVREHTVAITETVGIPAVKQPEVYSESTELVPIEAAGPQPSVPTGWAVCTATEPKSTVTIGRTLPIEIGNCRVMANADTDPDLLLRVCKTLVSLC